MGGGMPEFRCHELGWIRSDTSQEMFDQPPRSSVPAGAHSGRPKPETEAIEIEVGRTDCGTRRQRRPAEFESFTQGIRHPDSRPGSTADPHHVLGNRDIEEPIPVRTFGRHERPIDAGTTRAEGLLPLQVPAFCPQPRLRGGGGTGCPDAVGLMRNGLKTSFGEDGKCIDVALHQSSKREVSAGPVGKRPESDCRRTRARRWKSRAFDRCDLLEV